MSGWERMGGDEGEDMVLPKVKESEVLRGGEGPVEDIITVGESVGSLDEPQGKKWGQFTRGKIKI